MDPREAWALLDQSDVIFSAEQVQASIDGLAEAISARLSDRNPLVLAVMGGSIFFAGQLLPRLRFPLEFDYIHASRYGGEMSGSQVLWKVAPRDNVRGRTVLVLDDILDHGHTLANIRERILAEGAAAFYCAVLTEKEKGAEKPIRADFLGLTVPDRYVFGCGMDCKGLWRNLPAVHAVGGS
jgi:hypoxanthine phosphoribosyltransferase